MYRRWILSLFLYIPFLFADSNEDMVKAIEQNDIPGLEKALSEDANINLTQPSNDPRFPRSMVRFSLEAENFLPALVLVAHGCNYPKDDILQNWLAKHLSVAHAFYNLRRLGKKYPETAVNIGRAFAVQYRNHVFNELVNDHVALSELSEKVIKAHVGRIAENPSRKLYQAIESKKNFKLGLLLASGADPQKRYVPEELEERKGEYHRYYPLPLAYAFQYKNYVGSVYLIAYGGMNEEVLNQVTFAHNFPDLEKRIKANLWKLHRLFQSHPEEAQKVAQAFGEKYSEHPSFPLQLLHLDKQT